MQIGTFLRKGSLLHKSEKKIKHKLKDKFKKSYWPRVRGNSDRKITNINHYQNKQEK